VITDFPIWFAEATGVPGLALPDEPPAAVLDLAAAFPGTRTVIIHGGAHTQWPAILDAGGPGTECFDEIALRMPADPAKAAALAGTRVFRLVCP
jgi:predicted TIM-barrel fold metal-dependent hydrolase